MLFKYWIEEKDYLEMNAILKPEIKQTLINGRTTANVRRQTFTEEEYNNAIRHIEGTLKRTPELISEYKKYLIHLPLDFQIIFKMRFY